MIAHERVLQIRRLLADGTLSQRQISRLTGVSRATIGLIAAGRRADRPRQDADDGPVRFSGLPKRCGGCGGMVYQPCWLCHIRALKRLERFESRGAGGRSRQPAAGAATPPCTAPRRGAA